MCAGGQYTVSSSTVSITLFEQERFGYWRFFMGAATRDDCKNGADKSGKKAGVSDHRSRETIATTI